MIVNKEYPSGVPVEQQYAAKYPVSGVFKVLEPPSPPVPSITYTVPAPLANEDPALATQDETYVPSVAQVNCLLR